MKIIFSNKLKKHMEAHTADFIVSYEKLIMWCRENGKLDGLTKRFEVMVVEFPFNVGYAKLFETAPDDEIVYAQRINRDIYTRFVRHKVPYLINKCVLCLSKNVKKEGEYYMVTMFPGFKTEKEPEDNSIKTTEELARSLKFWEDHALLYDPKIIKKETETSECPYPHLYEKVKNNLANFKN